jgi:hypothetical protein
VRRCISLVEMLLISVGFADEHALILYVYLSNYDDGADESVLTVSPPQSFNRNLLIFPPVLHLLFQHMSTHVGI